MISWHLLVLSLPTENATARMRAWRSLKAAGAAVLRDGVYLLPASEAHRGLLQEVADDVRRHGGDAQVFSAEPADAAEPAALFDRSADFGALLAEIGNCHAGLSDETAAQVVKQARKLRKAIRAAGGDRLLPGRSATSDGRRVVIARGRRGPRRRARRAPRGSALDRAARCRRLPRPRLGHARAGPGSTGWPAPG